MKSIPRFLSVRPITDKRLFYLLSLTWGLPMNLAGAFVAAAMLLTGHRPRRFGPCVYFESGNDWGGMDWGMFIVVNKGAGPRLLAHELGHAMQNCRFGPFMLFLVGLPSSLRYWSRRFSARFKKRGPQKAYDAIWFERQATQTGLDYLAKNDFTANV